MVKLRSTHTFAELEVSAAAYDEIAGKLREAGYDHAFNEGAIDMHGIGVTRSAEQGASKALVTAPENPTLDDLITFYSEGNFRSGVTVRVPYRATREALERLRAVHEPPAALTMDQIERLCSLLDHNPIMAKDYAAVRQWFNSVRPSQPPGALPADVFEFLSKVRSVEAIDLPMRYEARNLQERYSTATKESAPDWRNTLGQYEASPTGDDDK